MAYDVKPKGQSPVPDPTHCKLGERVWLLPAYESCTFVICQVGIQAEPTRLQYCSIVKTYYVKWEESYSHTYLNCNCTFACVFFLVTITNLLVYFSGRI